MAAKNKVYGLKAITTGPIAGDGGMGTTLTEVFGATVKGTATLTSTDPTVEDIEIEESDNLYDQIETKKGTWALKASTYNVSALVMQELFGGAIVTGVWSPPADGASVQVYRSVKAESRTGIIFNFVRMKLTATANISFDKAKLGQIDWTGTLLQPTKAATAAMSIDFGV